MDSEKGDGEESELPAVSLLTLVVEVGSVGVVVEAVEDCGGAARERGEFCVLDCGWKTCLREESSEDMESSSE